MEPRGWEGPGRLATQLGLDGNDPAILAALAPALAIGNEPVKVRQARQQRLAYLGDALLRYYVRALGNKFPLRLWHRVEHLAVSRDSLAAVAQQLELELVAVDAVEGECDNSGARVAEKIMEALFEVLFGLESDQAIATMELVAELAAIWGFAAYDAQYPFGVTRILAESLREEFGVSVEVTLESRNVGGQENYVAKARLRDTPQFDALADDAVGKSLFEAAMNCLTVARLILAEQAGLREFALRATKPAARRPFKRRP